MADPTTPARVDLDVLSVLASVGEACECAAAVPTVTLRTLVAELRAHREREASAPSALQALTWLEFAARNDGPPTLHINKQLLRQQLEPIRAFLEPLPAPPAVKEPT
jgi:hypothetical protein